MAGRRDHRKRREAAHAIFLSAGDNSSPDGEDNDSFNMEEGSIREGEEGDLWHDAEEGNNSKGEEGEVDVEEGSNSKGEEGEIDVEEGSNTSEGEDNNGSLNVEEGSTSEVVEDESEVNFFNASYLKKHFCPRGRKTGAKAPIDSYRLSVAKVKEWYSFTLEEQKEKKAMWEKMSVRERKKMRDKIPNQATNGRLARKSTSVAGNTRARRDKRQREVAPSIQTPNPPGLFRSVIQSLAALSPSRRATRTKLAPKKKQRRSIKKNPFTQEGENKNVAHNVGAQNDRSVRIQTHKVMREFAKLVELTSPGFTHGKDTPRNQAYMIIKNNVAPAKRGKPPKNPRAQPTQFIFLGPAEKDNEAKKLMEVAKDLYNVAKSKVDVADYNIHFLCDSKDDAIGKKVESYISNNTVREPSARPIPFHLSQESSGDLVVNVPSPQSQQI
eukprot:scaffold8061_cov61-Attheya_sp.AAC.2